MGALAVPSERGSGRLLLVGNPNVGKSAIFGELTGRYVTVSNYPGTTVEVTNGSAILDGRRWEVVDTPGINTLIPQSEDEQVSRDILLNNGHDVVLQVGDMKNLRRVLLVTLQLAEMQVPFLLDLNMMDEARTAGISVDTGNLASIIGVPVVATVATRKKGLAALIDKIEAADRSDWRCEYPSSIERAVNRIEQMLPEDLPISGRSIALMLLAGDETLRPWLRERVATGDIRDLDEIIIGLNREFGAGPRVAINRTRLAFVDRIMAEVFQVRSVSLAPAWLTTISDLSTHPLWGIPFLLFTMAIAYLVVGLLGAGVLVDWFEGVFFQGWLNPLATRVVDAVLPVPLLRDLLVGEYGLITMALTYAVAIVLPIVGTFFIFFSFLEDSGYMPRLAVMANRIFRSMGLSGKAVLPMTLGLGCDTMATMTARIMETKKERVLVTLLLALGVPCSAQLGVILGMLAGLGPVAMLIWVGLVVGVLFAVGWLFSRLYPGDRSDFILELPPIRVPRISNILVKTLARIEWYLREAVPLFIVGTFILFVLDRLNFLPAIERLAAPVIQSALGLPVEATQAFLIGFLRRDYGAAGLFDLFQAGELDPIQALVALVVITLFMPCIANLLMIIKERGLKTAVWMSVFIVPFALMVGTVVNYLLRLLGEGMIS